MSDENYQDKIRRQLELGGEDHHYQDGPKDSTDYRWSGPSHRQMARGKHKKKNKKLVEKATYQHMQNILGAEHVPGLGRVGAVGIPECIRRIAPTDKHFYGRADELDKLQYQFSIALNRGNTEIAILFAEKVEKDAEIFIQDVKKKLIELGIHDVGFIPGYLPALYHWRASARMALAGHYEASSKEYYNEVTEDCSEALRLLSMEGEHSTAASNTSRITMLMERGRAWNHLGMLDEAVTDFRACCASIRALGPAWNRMPSIGQATQELLGTMALVKRRDKTPRPHYTNEERTSLQRELGIGPFQSDVYKCGNCGARQSQTVKLFRCGKCRERWFCSKECVTIGWKQGGHKNECRMLRPPLYFQMDRDTVKTLVESIKKDGVASLSGHMFFMQDQEDPSTFFDSLSDRSFKLRPATEAELNNMK